MNTTNKPLKIGILGGTFDPIHLGHILPAKQVFSAFNLDELLLIPAHIPPHKSTTKTTTSHRVNMAKLVCDEEACFTLDMRETHRSTLSYTIDTIKEIQSENPNATLYFIMGMDSLLSFTSWFQWEEIMTRCNLIVNTRPGYDLSTLNTETQDLLNKHQAQQLPNKHVDSVITGKIHLHTSENLDISSTNIRNNISQSQPYEHWLTSPVAKYIKQHKLYQ